jgi:ribosomal protein S27AE
MENENSDPIGEYKRICPYCGDEFTANHMNREFCSEKGGTLNYCKNRFKRQAKHYDQQLSYSEKEKLIDKLIVAEEVSVSPPISNTVTPLISTISIMAASLGNMQTRKLPKDYLKDKGAVYESFDNKYTIPGTELNVLTYGPYAMAWGYENHIILTHKKNIPWIQ